MTGHSFKLETLGVGNSTRFDVARRSCADENGADCTRGIFAGHFPCNISKSRQGIENKEHIYDLLIAHTLDTPDRYLRV